MRAKRKRPGRFSAWLIRAFENPTTALSRRCAVPGGPERRGRPPPAIGSRRDAPCASRATHWRGARRGGPAGATIIARDSVRY